MSNSLALSRPSILELARGGNFRAIAFWINSLLGPYGIYIHVSASRSGHLNILINFQRTHRRDFYIALRKHLVRFICYRLWTLNSERIRDVRMVARIAGESEILWKQSVRIVTPANRGSLQAPNRLRSLTRKGAAWIRFQVMRSAMVSRLAIVSFLLCYWLLYWELAGKQAGERTLAAMTASTITLDQPAQGSVTQVATKAELRAPTLDVVPENSIAQLAQGIAAQTAVATTTDQFKGKEVYEITPANNEKVVALTFDDGPWEGSTEKVLDILKQYDIKATFFWVGQALQKNPDVAKQVVAAGHAIGNHTWQHPMEDVDQLTAAQEIGNTARLIYEITGQRTNLFRPPGGNLSGQMAPYAKAQQDIVTMWSVESQDYFVSAPIIVDNVLSKIQPGGIVLMHDGGGDRKETVQALPQIISTLKRQGYRFVTVPELLTLQAKDSLPQTPMQPLSDPAALNPSMVLDGSPNGAPGLPSPSPAPAQPGNPAAVPPIDSAVPGTNPAPGSPTLEGPGRDSMPADDVPLIPSA